MAGQLSAPVFLFFSLHAAWADGKAATKALERDNTQAALQRLSSATEHLLSVGDLTTAPSIRLLAFLGFRDDMEALKAMSDAGIAVSAATRSFLKDVRGWTTTGSLQDALYRDRRIQFANVRKLSQALDPLDRSLETALFQLRHLSQPRLGALDRYLRKFVSRLVSARRGLSMTAELLRVLPLLAGEGTRTNLLLALQSPSEARGGGGLIGVIGRLIFIDGRPRLGRFEAVEEINRGLKHPVRAPKWFKASYSLLEPLKDPRQVNVSPSFSLTSELLTRMVEQRERTSYDGVLAVDPIAFGKLVHRLGGVRAAGWDKVITRSNARRLLLNRIYTHFRFQEDRQNMYLSRLMAAFWRQMTESLNGGELLAGLANAARTMHLKIYSNNSAIQGAFRRLGVDGDPRTFGPNTQMFFSNNLAGNKSDFYVHRKISTEVRLLANGSARVQSSVQLSNLPGPHSLSQPRRRLVNRSSVHFLIPTGARTTSLAIDGRRLDPFEGRDGPFPVAWQVLSIPPGRQALVEQSYVWPDAWDPEQGRFRLALVPQVTVWPDAMKISIQAPDGYYVARAKVNGDLKWHHPAPSFAVLSSRMKAPRVIQAELRPTE